MTLTVETSIEQAIQLLDGEHGPDALSREASVIGYILKDLVAERDRLLKDKERLNFLQDNTRGYGQGWILRDSTSRRGIRLHETSRSEGLSSVRDAIDIAMQNGFQGEEK